MRTAEVILGNNRTIAGNAEIKGKFEATIAILR